MLKQWIPAVKPEKEELEKRLNAAQEELGRLQMQIKEHKLPVLVLIEGWGAAGKGSTIGGIIKNIDPRFFKVASMSAPTEEEKRKPFLYRYFVKIPEAGKFEFLDSGWMDEVTKGRLRGELSDKQYAERIESIKRFERQLTDNGYLVLKLFFQIGKKEQKKRLEELGYGEDMLSIRLQNFCTIDEIAKEVGGFDFILADLGVSSMQIDNPKRGFSFKVDGPLDLRLNQEKGISAAERLDTISREELAGMLYENSDEPYCEELAKAITEEIRRGNRIDTTTKLRRVIERALDFLPEKEKQETVKKTCQRTFQALRIDVNHEFEVLYEFMEKLPGALKPGGRVAILTFHSGEDRLVKQALKEGYREGIYSDYAKDVIRPSAEECAQNGRARSTKMRWAVRAE